MALRECEKHTCFRYENEDTATLLSMKFDNKDDGTYKAELRAEVGTSSLNEDAVGSGTYEKAYQWIIKATPEQAANDKDTFMVSEIGLKLINFLTKESRDFHKKAEHRGNYFSNLLQNSGKGWQQYEIFFHCTNGHFLWKYDYVRSTNRQRS